MKPTLLFLGLFAFFSSLALADEVPGDILDQKDYDPNTPYYQILPPGWAFGARAIVSGITNGGYSLLAEKLLGYQKLGIFSLGIHLGIVPTALNRLENMNYGGVLRYQLHVIKNQVIVPTAAIIYDGYRLKDPGNNVQSFSTTGVLLGAFLNLGFFDSETARQGHDSMGLLRSYLTFEMRPSFNVSNSALTINKTLYYAGLRLEVE